MWLVISCALSASTAILSLGVAMRALSAARSAAHVQELPHQRLRSCESAVQSLAESREEQAAAMLDLANRLKMIKVRSASIHATRTEGEMPDPYTDPDRWRTAMNKRIAMQRINGGGK